MKKALFSLFVLMAAFSSQAAYLYWQVGNLTGIDDVTSGYAKATNGTGEPVTLTSYYLYQDEAGNLEWKPYTDDANITVSSETQFAAFIDESSNVGDGWSYYVELANDTETVARSTSIEYGSDDYLAYTSAASSSAELPDAQSAETWHASGASGYTPVPEPTSAILMMFGMAFLGLKRKNRSIA